MAYTFEQGETFIAAAAPIIAGIWTLWRALKKRLTEQDEQRKQRLDRLESNIMRRLDDSDTKVELHHTQNVRRFSRIDMALYKAGLIARPTDSDSDQ